jgi:hypothetical protein
MNAFCASVNFDAFIAFAPSQPGIITRKLQPQTRDFSGSRSQETTECSQRPISHLCFYGTLIYSVTSLAALSPRTACSKNRDASQVKGVGYEASRHQPRQCDLPSDAKAGPRERLEALNALSFLNLPAWEFRHAARPCACWALTLLVSTPDGSAIERSNVPNDLSTSR